MKLTLEQRSVSGMHRTEKRADGQTHEGYVFQDEPHRKGSLSGELYINKDLVKKMGRPVSVTIEWEKN